MAVDRTESDVLEELTPEARKLLKRVLEIERERLHIAAAAPTLVDEILQAVRAVLP